MAIDQFMIGADRLLPVQSDWDGQVAVVDLERADRVLRDMVLPPFPVIGIGDAGHPLAPALDVVVADAAAAEALATRIEAFPNASAAIVQLLRLLPGLSLESGLIAESMAYAMLQGSAEHRKWLGGQNSEEPAKLPAGRVSLARADEELVITLKRPEAGNAIDRTMRDALFEAFALAGIDSSIERVSLRATGKAFSLGADLSEFGTTGDPATAHAIRCRTLPARKAITCADRLDVYVQGACVGAGLELAAYAQRFTAAPNAWFQLPELEMGILPGAGGCVSLTRRIGRQRTAQLILTGKRLSARRALEWGLVDAIVDDPA